jgi:uncharacterized membrane protein
MLIVFPIFEERGVTMAVVEQSVLINQTTPNIFAYISDFRNDPKWQEGIVEARANPDGPATVGTQVRTVRRFMGQRMDSTAQVTELEPNKRMALKSVSGPFPFSAQITLEPVDTTTKVTFHVEIEPKGFFRLAEGMIAGNMKRDLEMSLANLKKQMES